MHENDAIIELEDLIKYNEKLVRLVKKLLDKGCNATTCGIRYEPCNGEIVKELKKLLEIK